MKIEFRQLKQVDPVDIIELMNHRLVQKHMPLAKKNFDEADCTAFLEAKQKLWIDHGYGPWAFLIDGQFVGWGGLQFEEGDADLAMVLHPKHWGKSRALYDLIIKQAFREMRLESITALLPPSRTRLKVMQRLGFKPDGELILDGQRFLKFRLYENKLSKGEF